MLTLALAVVVLQAAAHAGNSPAPQDALPRVVVESDDTEIRSSCVLVVPAKRIVDVNDNGVVRITGDDITVDLGGKTLRGCGVSSPPDTRLGIGIVVTGKRVTLRNGAVTGFRCGVLAQGADGSTFEHLDLSDNRSMRLLSTTKAEDGADWLAPHDNDNEEWVQRYGAGLCIERAGDVTVRDVLVRGTQNGIILDRVHDSHVFDNDCSFLSGWGLALWRSSKNVIARNAFDFCVRGYSHEVYSRGQDSAGILVFEQCDENLVAFNSATHCGDGVFGFAGREAIGEKPLPGSAPGADPTWHYRRGSNKNVFIANDFSFAAAHGYEMTFSFGNVLVGNRFEGNGIAGVWAGYCHDTVIVGNEFARNGGPKGDGEGGGIDIEHGCGNHIADNSFTGEGTAVELWWDDDAGLLALPWTKANGAASAANLVVGNRFRSCSTAVALRQSWGDIVNSNECGDCDIGLRLDRSREVSYPTDAFASARTPIESKDTTRGELPETIPPLSTLPDLERLRRELPGLSTPVGARNALGGREAIQMTAFGPVDPRSPSVFLEHARPHIAQWHVVGAEALKTSQIFGSGPLRVGGSLASMMPSVWAELPGYVMPYQLRVVHTKGELSVYGCIVSAEWQVTFFASPCDPRQDLEAWRRGATAGDSVTIIAPAIEFDFGKDGPSALRPGDQADELLAASKLPPDQFGTVATTRVRFPRGTFTLRVTSDDGVRVQLDGKTVIEDWTWQGPRESRAAVTFDEAKEVDIRIEHFDLDGNATLSFFIDGEAEGPRPVGPAPKTR